MNTENIVKRGLNTFSFLMQIWRWGMSESFVNIIIALVSFAGTLSGSYFSQRKATALIAYRLEKLEEKVNKHNNLVERTYQIEQNQMIHEEKIKVANHRISDLEKMKGV